MTRSSAARSLSVLLIASAVFVAAAADPDGGMRVGAPNVKSLGAMTFGPGNVLFIGDSEGGSILAVEIDDAAAGAASDALELTGLDQRIAQLLGTAPEDIAIQDLAVHPRSHNIYLTVRRGQGAEAQPVLLRVKRAGSEIEEVELDNVKHSMAAIPNAPASNPNARRNPRTFTVTDLAFADGQLYIAGLSNEEFSSAFRRMPYPFGGSVGTTTLEIYHVSHGQNETNAPVMTFLPHQIAGKQYILAAYTCTPLVAFDLASMRDGQHVVGRTVAELGAGNQPLDMIAFSKDGRESILIANSRHPLMRVDPADIVSATALKSPTKEPGIARVPISQTGIRQLADLDAQHVVVLQAGPNGLDLRTIAKSTL